MVGNPSFVLPHPPVFPSLRTMTLHDFTWDPTWFEQLGQLRQLNSLSLEDPEPSADEPEHPCVVGGLSALTYLSAWCENDDLPQLCVNLPTLKSLQKVKVFVWGSIELRTVSPGAAGSPAPVNTLQRVELLEAASVAVDFAGLPALTYLHLRDVLDLPGAPSIAGATSLRCLALGGAPGDASDDELVLTQPLGAGAAAACPAVAPQPVPPRRVAGRCGGGDGWAHPAAGAVASQP